MNNIKKFRLAFNLTQERFAETFGTTQQTVARWEKGSIEPNAKILRDMALFFGTSVDEILGLGQTNSYPKTNVHNGFVKGDIDAFWGHIGLRYVGNELVYWYPIGIRWYNRINSFINSNYSKFIVFESLDNRLVAFYKKNISKISFLDDDVDEPSDWHCPIDYQGVPSEIYKSVHRLGCFEFYEKDLRGLYNYLERKIYSLPISDDEENQMNVKIQEFSKNIDDDSENLSLNYVFQVVNYLIEHKLYEEDAWLDEFYYSKIALKGASLEKIGITSKDVSELVKDMESDFIDGFISIKGEGEGIIAVYNIEEFLYIEIPSVLYNADDCLDEDEE